LVGLPGDHIKKTGPDSEMPNALRVKESGEVSPSPADCKAWGSIVAGLVLSPAKNEKMVHFSLQCFDAVGWAARRASGL